MRTIFRSALVALICLNPVLPAAFAGEAKPIEVPAGDLIAALKTFAKQTGVEVVYRSDRLQGLQTRGVSGTLSPEEALAKILEGTPLALKSDPSGAMLITGAEGSAGARAGQKAASPLLEGGSRADMEGSGVKLAQGEVAATSSGALGSGAGHEGVAKTEGEAQEESLEEILVTAQKRVERLQEVPVPVSAVSGETLVSSNLLRVEDYYRKLPGLSLTLSGNGSEPQVFIRGVATSLNSNPTTGTVIDEVSYGRSRSLSFTVPVPDIDPGDLERVEVLRGPQGTLYGASSIGGLLKFVTVDPSTAGFSGRLQVGSTHIHKGNDLGYSVRGGINMPVSDTLAVRLSAFTLEEPGYIDNAETGERDLNDRESEGGRFSALWRPSDRFSLKASALLQDSVRHGMSESNITLEPNLARSQLFGVGGYERESDAYSVTMTGMLGALELVSATGYIIDELNSSLESSAVNFFPGATRSSLITWMENRKFTQELRATLPIGERLSWLAGAFYTEEKDQYRVNRFAHTGDGTIAGLVLRNLGLPATQFEEKAVFTNLTVDVTDRFDVQFGGRYSESEQVFARASVTQCTSIAECTGRPLDAPPNFFQTIQSQDDAFTYLVTPRLRLSPDLMVYARLASGYRIGGPNFNCGVIPDPLCQFEPDETKNYEIGFKGSFLDRAVFLDASVYYIDWKNIQVGPLLFAPGVTYTTNASRAKSQGVELSVESKPLTGLGFSGWVVFNDAELTEDSPGLFGVIREGTRLPFSSRWTGGLSAEQEFPISLWEGAKGWVGVDGSYVGDRAGTLSNTNTVRIKPSYVQIDLRTGVTYDTWTLNVFVNNVADKRGILRGGDDGIGVNLVNYIQPRTIGLSLLRNF